MDNVSRAQRTSQGVMDSRLRNRLPNPSGQPAPFDWAGRCRFSSPFSSQVQCATSRRRRCATMAPNAKKKAKAAAKKGAQFSWYCERATNLGKPIRKQKQIRNPETIFVQSTRAFDRIECVSYRSECCGYRGRSRSGFQQPGPPALPAPPLVATTAGPIESVNADYFKLITDGIQVIEQAFGNITKEEPLAFSDGGHDRMCAMRQRGGA